MVEQRRIPDGLIGALHVPPLPGDPLWRGRSFDEIETFVLRDAETYVAGGIDALIVENFGSVPFAKGTAADPTPAVQVVALALIARRVRREHPAVLLGLNCLRNDAASALAIAALTGAHFIRINVHVGAYVTDQGIIEGDAARTLRRRRELACERVALLADVHVKHAAPLAATSLAQVTRDCLHRGLADGVIVTGPATGAAVLEEEVLAVVAAAEGAPVFVGSGLSTGNVDVLAGWVHGAIVGTSVKHGGRVDEPVDGARVRRLVDAWRAVGEADAEGESA